METRTVRVVEIVTPRQDAFAKKVVPACENILLPGNGHVTCNAKSFRDFAQNDALLCPPRPLFTKCPGDFENFLADSIWIEFRLSCCDRLHKVVLLYNHCTAFRLLR